MGNDDDGDLALNGCQRLTDQGFCSARPGRRWARPAPTVRAHRDQRPGDRNALALPAGQLAASFPEVGVESPGQIVDVAADVGLCRGPPYCLVVEAFRKKRMFSATVPVNSRGSWGTKATRRVHQARSTCAKGSPATVMTPDVGLRNPRISCARVDWFAPEGPITPRSRRAGWSGRPRPGPAVPGYRRR